MILKERNPHLYLLNVLHFIEIFVDVFSGIILYIELHGESCFLLLLLPPPPYSWSQLMLPQIGGGKGSRGCPFKQIWLLSNMSLTIPPHHTIYTTPLLLLLHHHRSIKLISCQLGWQEMGEKAGFWTFSFISQVHFTSALYHPNEDPTWLLIRRAADPKM